MNKIVIIGSPGAGKSTLARELGSRLHINVIHLDRVFWGSDWKEKPRDERIDILRNLVREKQWIIEGTYLGSSEPRLSASDTIIFLDINPVICLKHIIGRHREYRGCSRRDIPEGCEDNLNLIRILKVLVFPFKGKIELKKRLLYYKSMSKEVIWLKSSNDIEVLLAKLGAPSNEKQQYLKTHSTLGKRQLALAKR